jgi:hypothetical protein
MRQMRLIGAGVLLGLTALGLSAHELELRVCPPAALPVSSSPVDVPILINEPGGVDAFGFRCIFDTDRLAYVATLKSGITGEWFALDGVENSPGEVTIGGLNADAIPVGQPADTLCYLRFNLLTSEPGTLLLRDFVDDLAGAPNCAGTVLEVEPISWGRLKALRHDDR